MIVREYPPLRISHRITTPSGRKYRWAKDVARAEDAPNGSTGSSTMPGGFEGWTGILPRDPGIDYADLEPLTNVEILGAGGARIVGEYRIEKAPAVSGDDLAVSPAAVGWQAALDDNKAASDIIIDRDLSHWQGLSTQRHKNLVNSVPSYSVFDLNVDQDPTSLLPAIALTVTGAWTNRAAALGAYDAGALNRIAKIMYTWIKGGANVDNTNGNWSWAAVGADNDTMVTNAESTGSLRAAGPGSGTLTFAAVKRFLEIQLVYAAAGGGAGIDYSVYWVPTPIGNHGLTLQGSVGPDSGFLASDVIKYLVRRWAPYLQALDGDFDVSTFVIPHLAWPTITGVTDMVRDSNRFELNDWAVWEQRRFHYNLAGTAGRKWKARVAQTKLQSTGRQIDRVWNSIAVQFTDTDGSSKVVGPTGSGADSESASLIDTDINNPANELGITRRDLLVTGTATFASAIRLGVLFLQLTKALDRSGSAEINGWIQDDRGILHPYWAVRAGDQISFVDAHDTSYRTITRAEWSDDTKTNNIDLDAPPEGMDAILERLGVVLVRLGLA